MVSLEQLLNFRPVTLGGTASAWQDAANSLAEHSTALKAEVREQLGRGVWGGQAGESARGHLDRLQAQYSEHEQGLRPIANTLRYAGGGLTTAQSALNQALGVARQAGLDVGTDGSVSWNLPRTLDLLTNPTGIATIGRLASEVSGLIGQSLEHASTVDNQTAAALRQAVPGGHSMVSGAPGERIDSQVGADPRRDADEAARLAKKMPNLSDDELSRLEEILDADVHNPEFATNFTKLLGQRGVLEFAGRIATGFGNDASFHGGQNSYAYEDIQVELAGTLATAMDSTQQPHLDQGWIKQLESLGSQRINIGYATVHDPGYQPYGYQMLGVLMHYGTYPSSFLNEVGQGVIDFEKHNPNAWSDRPWGQGFQLNLMNAHGDAGYDPMAGMMAGMSNNKQAAEQFFDPAHNDHVQYLLKDRPWDADAPSNTYPGDGHEPGGKQLLGDALATAATGGTHSPVDASIMSKTAEVLTQPNVDITDNMKPSLGKMLGAYIGDVNYVYDNGTDTNPSGHGTWTDPTFPKSDDAHALFDKDKLDGLINTVSQNPDAMVSMTNAEKVYSTFQFQADAQTKYDQHNLIGEHGSTAASVLGKITANYTSALEQHNDAVVQAYNDRINATGGIADFVLGKVVGKIPVVGDLAAQGAQTLIDNAVANAQQDSSTVNRQQLLKQYQSGRHQIGDIAFQAMWNNQLWPKGDRPPNDLFDADNKPIDLSTIKPGSKQDNALHGWRDSPGYVDTWRPQLRKIADHYELGWLDPTNEATS